MVFSCLAASSQSITIIGNFYKGNSLSRNGEHICGTSFNGTGEGSYYWSQSTGEIPFFGIPNGITNTGKIVGTIMHPSQLIGTDSIEFGATFDYQSKQWTLLPVNSQIPTPLSNYYSSVWACNSDGSTLYGMVWPNPANTWAYSYNSALGYSILNTDTNQSARPSFCNGDGRVAVGWVQRAYWVPAVWKDGVEIIPNADASGEFNAVSENGVYAVAGNGYDSLLFMHNNSFKSIYSPIQYLPKGIANNGFMVGSTVAFPLMNRNGFVYDSINGFRSFSSYASSLGFNTAGWIFYSVDGISSDGSRMLVSGYYNNQDVTFLFDLQSSIDQQETKLMEVSISPNPIDNQLKFDIELNSNSPVTISIFDIIGNQILLPIEKNCWAGRNNLDIDFQNFSHGIYFLSIETSFGKEILKFIK